MFDEFSEREVTSKYGIQLLGKGLSALGFADDTTLTAKNKESAAALLHMAGIRMGEIGSKIKSKKTSAIIMEKGQIKFDVISTLNKE